MQNMVDMRNNILTYYILYYLFLITAAVPVSDQRSVSKCKNYCYIKSCRENAWLGI